MFAMRLAIERFLCRRGWHDWPREIVNIRGARLAGLCRFERNGARTAAGLSHTTDTVRSGRVPGGYGG
jgi:hypothetical protein